MPSLQTALQSCWLACQSAVSQLPWLPAPTSPPAVTSGDLDRAQELLVYGGATAQHNLELFWTRLQVRGGVGPC